MATWDELGIEIRGTRTLQKVKCPACSHTRRNKADKSLSVNVGEGLYNCHNCGWKGHVSGKSAQEEKADWMHQHKEAKAWAKPSTIELPLAQKTIDWFKTRGIEPETLQYFKVSESKEWMPDKGEKKAGKRTCINFNYFRNNEKINVKYRDALKCFRMTKDAELVLYNLDALKDDRKDMLICEGEIDAMTFYQAGHYGATSVPNGASKGNARLEYLDNCAEVFDRMEKIIIATDGDEAGTFLRHELTRRLGSHRCWLVSYPDGCKDANEVQIKYGLDAVRKLWENATPPPLEDILTVDDMRAEINNIYLNGWPKIEPIGYVGFDHLLNFAPGEVTTITGIPQHGKDEFIRQILIRKASRYGEKAGIFNYEEPAWVQAIKCIQKFIGKPFRGMDMMNRAQMDLASKFVNDHVFFLDTATADLTMDGILKKGEELVLRKGIKYYVIGPYNCLEGGRDTWQSEGEYVSMLYQKMTRFALRHQVHIFFVAHPTKVPKDQQTKKFIVPNLYMIAGSANFFAKTQNGITVYRNYEENTTDIHVQKCKFFFNGKLGMQTFDFDVATGRYAEIGTPFESELDHQRKQQVQTSFDFQAEAESESQLDQASSNADQPQPKSTDQQPPTVLNSYPPADLSNWNGPADLADVPF